jgi:hypothetical protein
MWPIRVGYPELTGPARRLSDSTRCPDDGEEFELKPAAQSFRIQANHEFRSVAKKQGGRVD